MFKKINRIENLGIFQNFDWDIKVRDTGNNIVEFKDINILYGRNYSGKTTLSRIFRSLEIDKLPDKYSSPKFSVMFDKEGIQQEIQQCLNFSDCPIRVFNKDFIKDNLRFVIDDNHGIKSFAILGEENQQIENKIKLLESELGSEELKTGLYLELNSISTKFNKISKEKNKKETELEKKLQAKANTSDNAIKHNRLYGDANYNVTKLTADINTVLSPSYPLIDSTQEGEYCQLLKEELKDEIPKFKSLNLQLSVITEKAKGLLERKVEISELIQELIDDSLLSEWVRSGRDLHKDKRQNCGFCGNRLPDNIWEKLNKHFSKQSETLRNEIEILIKEIDKGCENLKLDVDKDNFYSNFHDGIKKICEQFDDKKQEYKDIFEQVKLQLNNRKKNISMPSIFEVPDMAVKKSLLKIEEELEAIRVQSNKFSSDLGLYQIKAKNELRLHDVYKFTSDINYKERSEELDVLKTSLDEAKDKHGKISILIKDKKEKICQLINQLTDETKAAKTINNLLNGFFDHETLFLEVVNKQENKMLNSQDDEGISTQYEFEIIRDENKAYNLSEGECSLVAFCYFMAKLKGDTDITHGNKPIIWIDDPISSLDSNHIFAVYALIKSNIIDSKKYKQLFISTHNLDFLKYLKQASSDYVGKNQNKRKIREFFLLENSHGTGNISTMPKYLKKYVTEFNYLFHQIYKCAKSDLNNSDYSDFYCFGNNARKFLEIYLYYRYPNSRDTQEKLKCFFDNEKFSILIERLNNEYSHLSGTFERASIPVDVPEIQKVAQLILMGIEEKDSEQYQALVDSIN